VTLASLDLLSLFPWLTAQPRLHDGLLRWLHSGTMKLYRTNMDLLSIGLSVYLPDDQPDSTY
jgi:hypothetical protein